MKVGEVAIKRTEGTQIRRVVKVVAVSRCGKYCAYVFGFHDKGQPRHWCESEKLDIAP